MAAEIPMIAHDSKRRRILLLCVAKSHLLDSCLIEDFAHSSFEAKASKPMPCPQCESDAAR